MASTKKRMLRFGRFTAIAAVAALAITGCSTGGNGDGGGDNGSGNGDGGGEPVGGGTIVYQLGGDPNLVMPPMTTGFADQQLGCVVFQGLTQLDPTGVPIPHLAESWDVSEDGREYTLHLVEANWHDGEPFTSEDVKFTYETLSSQYGPTWGTLGALLEGVETPEVVPRRVV